MRRASNYATITGPTGVEEKDSFTCFHCQRIIHVQPKHRPEDLGGLCKVCNSLICPRCYDLRMKGGPCVPWEKKMYIAESRERLRRAAGLL